WYRPAVASERRTISVVDMYLSLLGARSRAKCSHGFAFRKIISNYRLLRDWVGNAGPLGMGEGGTAVTATRGEDPIRPVQNRKAIRLRARRGRSWLPGRSGGR